MPQSSTLLDSVFLFHACLMRHGIQCFRISFLCAFYTVTHNWYSKSKIFTLKLPRSVSMQYNISFCCWVSLKYTCQLTLTFIHVCADIDCLSSVSKSPERESHPSFASFLSQLLCFPRISPKWMYHQSSTKANSLSLTITLVILIN